MKDSKASIIKINKLIDYQSGSVVSKEIIKQPSGTVTIFAFDKGQGLSEHKAPFDALVQIVEGEAEIIISKRLFSLKGGDIVVIPAGKFHSLKAKSKFKMILTMVRN